MLAKHRLLDLIEGSSWVRYLDCGSVNDILTVFIQQVGLFWCLKGKLIVQALSHKSLPTSSEKRQGTSKYIMSLVEIKMSLLMKTKRQVSCSCKSNFLLS